MITLRRKQFDKYLSVFIGIVILMGLIPGVPPLSYRFSSYFGYLALPFFIFFYRPKISYLNIFFIVGLFLASFLTILYAPHNDIGFFQGLDIFLPIVYFIIGVSLSKAIKENILFIFTTIFIFSIFFIVIQIYTHNLYSDNVRLDNYSFWSLLLFRYSSFMGNSNIYAGFLTLYFVILNFYFSGRSYKTEILLLLYILLVYIIVESRGALIALMILWLFFQFRYNKMKKTGLLVAVIFFIFLYFLIIILKDKYYIDLSAFRIFSLNKMAASKSVLSREIVFNYGVQAIKNHPFLGNGFRSQYFLLQENFHRYFESATILVLAERGIINYMFYVIFILTLLFSKNKFFFVVGLTIILFDYFETVFVLKQLLCFLGFIYGGLYSYNTIGKLYQEFN